MNPVLLVTLLAAALGAPPAREPAPAAAADSSVTLDVPLITGFS